MWWSVLRPFCRPPPDSADSTPRRPSLFTSRFYLCLSIQHLAVQSPIVQVFGARLPQPHKSCRPAIYLLCCWVCDFLLKHHIPLQLPPMRPLPSRLSRAQFCIPHMVPSYPYNAPCMVSAGPMHMTEHSFDFAVHAYMSSHSALLAHMPPPPPYPRCCPL